MDSVGFELEVETAIILGKSREWFGVEAGVFIVGASLCVQNDVAAARIFAQTAQRQLDRHDVGREIPQHEVVHAHLLIVSTEAMDRRMH